MGVHLISNENTQKDKMCIRDRAITAFFPLPPAFKYLWSIFPDLFSMDEMVPYIMSK